MAARFDLGHYVATRFGPIAIGFGPRTYASAKFGPRTLCGNQIWS